MASDAAPVDLSAWLARLEARPLAARRLSAVRAVAERLGVLRPAGAVVVVAGTNGKGSVVAFLERLLLAQGNTVGTTTSPHLHAFNERIRIGGAAASDAQIADALAAVEAARHDQALTYFDHATLAALLLICRAKVDVAVLEAGLGGRLDAVNVVDAQVTVITNVGLDHERQLGRTRELIGAQKAGVLRRRTPAVVGEPWPPAPVLDRAAALAAPIRLAGRDFGHSPGRLWLAGVKRPVAFAYDDDRAVAPANAAIALQASALLGATPTQAQVRKAALMASNPGRFEVLQSGERSWVLDVAHNPAAARFLADQLRSRFGGRTLAAIVGCLAEKNIVGISQPLRPLLETLAYADTLPPRGQSALAMRRAAGDPNAIAGPLDAVVELVEAQSPPNGVILVCGSFDLIERMRARLHLDAAHPPKRRDFASSLAARRAAAG